jgi:hypothetical protein
MSKEIRSLHATEFRVSKADDGSRTISGTVTYNTPSCDLGGFIELIAPGAFAGSISGDVLLLRDHEPTLLMGRTKSGTLSLSDTSKGLKFNCKLPNTTSASDLAESIDRKDLDGCSFGFITIDDDWAYTDGQTVRTIKEAELLEISPCSFAAYPSNSVSVRSCPPELRSNLTASEVKPPTATPEAEAPKTRSTEGCQCECQPCLDGNCANCSDDPCDCDGCDCNEIACMKLRVSLPLL